MHPLRKLQALLLFIAVAVAWGANEYTEHWFEENPIQCVDLRDYKFIGDL